MCFMEPFKYYFADFVRKGGTPPLYGFFFRQKRSYGFGGYPPPLYGYFFAQKCLKMVFFAQKHLFFGKKKLRIWGVPPFTDFFPGKKGVTDLGGTPLPPFTDFSPKNFFKKG